MAKIQFPEGVAFEKGTSGVVTKHDVETGNAAIKISGILFNVVVKESEENLIEGANIRINAEVDGLYNAEVVVTPAPTKEKTKPTRAGCGQMDKSRLFG